MSNSVSNSVHTLDTAGAILTDGCSILKIVFIPNAANDNLIFTDDDDGALITLKARASDANPCQWDWVGGFDCPSLKLATITGGTAYVYLRAKASIFR